MAFADDRAVLRHQDTARAAPARMFGPTALLATAGRMARARCHVGEIEDEHDAIADQASLRRRTGPRRAAGPELLITTSWRPSTCCYQEAQLLVAELDARLLLRPGRRPSVAP